MEDVKEDLKRSKGTLVKGTCKWIESDPQYMTWRSGIGHELLWISGTPGRGKTMLAMFLVEQLLEELKRRRDQVLIFFFCSFSDPTLNTASAILRSFIYQLVSTRKSLHQYIPSYFKNKNNKTREAIESATVLWDIFKTILGDPSTGTVLCVLDGLDECNLESQDFLINSFASIATHESGHISTRLQTVIISRTIPKLRQLDVPHVELDQNHDVDFHNDVRLFIDDRLSALPFFKAQTNEFTAKKFVEALFTGAKDTFLWIGPALKEISGCSSMDEAEATLRDLPQSLHAIYDRMLSGGIIRHSVYVHRIAFLLHAVALARRPFTIRELETLYTLEYGMGNLASEHAVSLLIRYCKDFLRVQSNSRSKKQKHDLRHGQDAQQQNRGENDCIILCHESARRYLSRPESDKHNEILSALRVQEEGHLKIARICLSVIRSSFLQHTTQSQQHEHRLCISTTTSSSLVAETSDSSVSSVADQQVKKIDESHLDTTFGASLFHYAAHHWAAHVRQAHQHKAHNSSGHYQKILNELIDRNGSISPISDDSLREAWIKWYQTCYKCNWTQNCIHDYMLTASNMDQLTLACALGVDIWVQALLAAKPQHHLASLTDALYSAVINDCREVVTTLYHNGVIDINSQALPGHQDQQDTVNTPLMIACTMNMPRMVEHLIRLGASVNLRPQCGFTALEFVARRGRMRNLLPLLLPGCSNFEDTETQKLVNETMDPRSIAASAVGLVATAGTVYKALNDFTGNTLAVPRSAYRMSSIVKKASTMVIDINQHIFTNRLHDVQQVRREMIRLDHLAVVLSHLILVLSELESLTISVSQNGSISLSSWTEKEKDFQRLVPDLECTIRCLKFMLSIMTWWVNVSVYSSCMLFLSN